MPMPTFKNGSGAWLLKPLFFELADTEKEFVLYTLKPEDHKVVRSFGSSDEIEERVYPSLRRLYLEMDDDTEYDFASAYFGGWPHWKRLNQATWFQDYMEELRSELRTKREAALRAILKKKAAQGDYQSTKFLLDDMKRSKVGRPSKDKIKQEADVLFREKSDIEDDLDRIRAMVEATG